MRCDKIEKLLGLDILAILELLVTQDDGQRDDLDVEAFGQVNADIGCTVGDDADHEKPAYNV